MCVCYSSSPGGWWEAGRCVGVVVSVVLRKTSVMLTSSCECYWNMCTQSCGYVCVGGERVPVTPSLYIRTSTHTHTYIHTSWKYRKVKVIEHDSEKNRKWSYPFLAKNKMKQIKRERKTQPNWKPWKKKRTNQEITKIKWNHTRERPRVLPLPKLWMRGKRSKIDAAADIAEKYIYKGETVRNWRRCTRGGCQCRLCLATDGEEQEEEKEKRASNASGKRQNAVIVVYSSGGNFLKWQEW